MTVFKKWGQNKRDQIIGLFFYKYKGELNEKSIISIYLIIVDKYEQIMTLKKTI